VDVENVLRDIVSDMQARVADASSDTVTLSRVFILGVLLVGTMLTVAQGIRSSTESLHELKQTLDQLALNAVHQATEVATAENDRLRANSDLALTIQHSLEEIRRQKTGIIAAEFGELQASLVSVLKPFFPVDVLIPMIASD
jgi:galactitol-specific phosphotransferase system IIB component